MKKVFCFVFIVLAMSGNPYAQEADFGQYGIQEPMRSLSEFDSRRNEILGPMDIPVPESYFAKDMSSALESGELYHSSFRMTPKEMRKNHVLALYNDPENGPYCPAVVSVKRPDGKFANYVAEFGKEPELIIDLADEFGPMGLAEEKKIAAGRAADRRSEFVVNVISSFPFSGEVRRNDSFLKELEVTEPDNDVRELRSLGSGICCPSIIGKMEAWVKNNENGGCSRAWFSLEKGYGYAIGVSTHYYGELTWYYPTIVETWHYPDTTKSYAYCKVSYPSGNCSSPQTLHYTYHNETCGGLTREHRWHNMRDLFSGGSAWCEETMGCEEGLTWTITLEGPWCP